MKTKVQTESKLRLKKMEETIQFYNVNETYGAFSNFAYFPIQLKNKVWKTTEHYFQAQKFKNQAYQEKIRKVSSPMKAAELGRSRKEPILKNWDTIRLAVMYEAVKTKFTQHLELKQLLLDTQNAKIMEHTASDSYWGDGGDGKGENWLGKTLMRVRAELRQESDL